MRYYSVAVIIAAGLLCSCNAALSPQVRNDIAIQVASKHKAMQACYGDALKRDKTISGKATLTFLVAPDGSFQNAQVGDGVGDAELKTCVAGHASSLKLGSPAAKPILVTYPLSFDPEPVP